MSAALTLFRAKGYEATTIEEITDAADVSPRTFFHHFASKEEVLFGGHGERRAELIAELRDRLATQPLWSAVHDALMTVVDALEVDPSFYRERAHLYTTEPVLRSAVLRLNDELIDDMSTVFAERLKLDQQEILPTLIATLANGALRSAIDCWVSAGGREDLRTLAIQALEIVRPAIARAEEQASRPDSPRARRAR